MSTLENLTDDELIELDSWVNTLTKRELDTVINSYSTKFGYHIIRLLLQCEQIMLEHDMDIERNSEILKSIRRGEWTLERLMKWFEEKETALESLYATSTLRAVPDETAIKMLLIDCLEQHYGSLKEAVTMQVPVEMLVRELESLVDKYKKSA